ncbi:MAG: ABC transporter permease, partial [Chloroflexi bacterium]|nr:ABC transporter permease [Chloroflexota bacterium]
MQNFVIRRVLSMVPTLIGATLLVFLIMRVVPGDIALHLLGDAGGTIDPETLAKFRHELGTDRPLYVQYLSWLSGIPRGDLGDSMWNRLPVADEIFHRVPITAQLALMAALMGFFFGLPLGIISALKRATWVDLVSRVTSIVFLAAPTFWLGLLIIMFLSRVFNWIPPLGYNVIWENPKENLSQLIFPALVIASHMMAIVARMTRSTMLEVLREDYVRTAR